MEIQHDNFLGQVSTIMRSSTSNDSDHLSYFKNINNDIGEKASMNNNSLIVRLNNSHDEIVNRGRINGQLPLDHTFGFCKALKKNKIFSIHLTFRTGDLQKIIFTSKANDINVLLPNSDTQVMFKESIEKKIQRHMILGIQNVNYQPMVINFNSIMLVLNTLLLLNS